MLKETRSTCCYCGVGCGVIISSEDDRITGVRGDPDHPANFGRLCTKGSTLHLTAKLDTRVLQPELRTSRQAPRQPTDWDTALDHVADRFADTIRQHGPDSVAFYISGQLLTEDYYVFNKLAKGLIGTNNVDTNSRLCMSSAVSGYKLTLGADAPPACYEDIDHTRCLFIAGSNTAYAHPIIFRRIEDAKARNPDMKIVVVDPRRTDTANAADLHLAIQPGTDVALFNGMLHIMLWEGMLDQTFIREHTNGFDALKETVREYTPKMVADICGIREADLVTAAKWFGSGPSLSMYCMGLNQSIHGSDKNAALINLHLATGQIGKPGAGPFSLTGQPNAMGGREVGGMANLLSGHRDLDNPEHRAEVAALWGVDDVPAKPGKTAVEMFDALKSGEIKAIWIACTNPAHSMPDLNHVRAALDNAELVVLQDAYGNTDTNIYADVVLPATSWGEKEGTVTNSERRITHITPAVAKPGAARHDWEIVVDFAQRLEQRLGKASTLFNYLVPETIFNEHRESTRGRDLDITGLSYQQLDEQGPQQWPLGEKVSTGLQRLYSDGIFPKPDGRAQFHIAHYKPTADKTDARLPLHLLTGRLRDQWHGMSRTGTVAQLFNHVDEPVISLNQQDMERRQIKSGDLVKVSNKRGSLTLRAQPSDEIQPAQSFIPMHWGSQFMSGLGCNALMPSAFDKTSRQPELKHTAVKLEKVELAWQMTVMRNCDDMHLLEAIRRLLPGFDYASCGLYGRGNGMVVLQAAHHAAPDAAVIDALDALLGMTEGAPMLNYQDARRGISKRILVEPDAETGRQQVTGVRLIGETLAAEWLREVMSEGQLSDELRRWALAPLSAPPTGQRSRGKIVCNCLNVAENEIIDTIQMGADFITLQNKLKCGTQCGSCVPELKKLVQLHGRTAA
ncbi:molybdopterin-dependent oxidoreductase [Methylovorus menthalis]|uniref:nitrate reductase n=1 Tax=Methylovorus menthalis TaxID=1002227 RepID=UPI001E555BC6|nr:nitrate reductase [Methylovorus menthalis]MCB4810241.1 molybdopterin-dependent oxidoreductase [Methylovorus menthalis]